MADRIRLDSNSLEQISSRLNRIQNELSNAADEIYSLHVSREGGSDLRMSFSSSYKTISSRSYGNNVSGALSQMRRSINELSSYARALSKNTTKVQENIKATEKQLSRLNPTAGSANAPHAAAVGASVAAQAVGALSGRPVIGLAGISSAASLAMEALQPIIPWCVVDMDQLIGQQLMEQFRKINENAQNGIYIMTCDKLGYPTDQSKWSDTMREKYAEELKKLQFFQDGDILSVVGDKYSAICVAGELISTRSETSKASKLGVTEEIKWADGSYEKEEGAFKLTLLKYKDTPKKAKDNIEIEQEEFGNKAWVDGKRVDEAVKDPFGKSASILTVGAEWEKSGSLFHADQKYENGKLSGELKADFSKWSAEASVEGGLYTRVKNADGSISLKPYPGLNAHAGASYTVASAEASGEFEVIDGISLNGNISSEIGRVGAEGNLKIGYVDGKWNAFAKAEAEAVAVEVKGDVGLDLFGAKGKVGGSAYVGVGAHANFGVVDGKIVMDVGGAIGVGLSVNAEIDVSGVIDNVGKVVNTVGEAANTTAKFVGDAVNTTTKFVGDAVNTTAKAVGDAVNNTTKAVGNAVNTTAKAVGDAVNNTTKAVGSAVNNTAKFVGNAVGNVGKAGGKVVKGISSFFGF